MTELTDEQKEDPPASNYMVRGRVPGGWIYSGWDHEKDCVKEPAVFVPDPALHAIYYATGGE